LARGGDLALTAITQTSTLGHSCSCSQDASELGQRLSPHIVERPQNALAIFDGECDDLAVEPERLLEERARRLIYECDELANVLVGDPQTGEIHLLDLYGQRALLVPRTTPPEMLGDPQPIRVCLPKLT
jgi:hypothetical protein